jgi:hypothetical protein
MQTIPDVVGKPLGEAEDSVREAGLIPRLIVTSPPGQQAAAGNFRVIRQRQPAAGTLELVIALEHGGKEVGEDAF